MQKEEKKSQHTPGPWERRDGQGAPDAHAVRVVDAQGRTLFETSSLDSAEQDAAFDVAAAAPELLEALQLVLDFHAEDTVAFVAKYGTGIGTRELCDRVRAAMAKAVAP